MRNTVRTTRHATVWRMGAIITTLALVVAACGPADDAPDAPEPAEEPDAEDAPAAPEGDPIVIGGSLGLTGAFADPSAVYQLAYEFWLDDINARGGLLGRPVELLIYDDESTPATAQALYERLIFQDEVDLVLAPFSTFVGGAIIPIVESADMVLWNGGFVGIELFFEAERFVGSYSYQEPQWTRGIFGAIDAMPEDERPSRVGILTEQNPFPLVVRDGLDGEEGVVNLAAERGMEVVFNEEYSADTTDFTSLIERARAADVEVFFALSLPVPGGLIAQTVYDTGFRPDIYCACGSQITSLPYWADLGDAGEGVMSTHMALPSDDYPGINELHDHLRAELGAEELSTYGPVAMSILQVLEQAVEATGSLDQDELHAFVTSGEEFMTVNGPMVYDEHGIPAFNAVGVQVLNGTNEIIWPPERATADPVIPIPMP